MTADFGWIAFISKFGTCFFDVHLSLYHCVLISVVWRTSPSCWLCWKSIQI